MSDFLMDKEGSMDEISHRWYGNFDDRWLKNLRQSVFRYR